MELDDADPASWVCKKADGSIQALFWNYTPIVPPKGMNDQQFYDHILPAREISPVVLRLAGLPAGSYSLTIYQTGYEVNDVFTRYLQMGAPSQLTPIQVQLLREQSDGVPDSVETIQVEAGRPFVRTFPMRENDVYLVKLDPLDGQ